MRSKEAFRQALIHLMNEMPYKKITITQLCKHSGYSRNAFYNLFSSKEELVDYTVSTIITELNNQLLPTKNDTLSNQIMEATDLLKKYRRMLKLFLKDNKIKGFREKLFNIIYDNLLLSNILNQKNPNYSTMEKHFAAIYFTASSCGVLFKLIQDDLDFTPKKVLDTFIHLKNPNNHAALLGLKPFKNVNSYDTSKFKDLRVIRTENAFYEAFISLIQQKPYNHIKIKDVIEMSGYNKSTFYKYYDSMGHLLSVSINRFVKQLFLSMAQATNGPNDKVLERLFSEFHQHKNGLVDFLYFSNTPGLYSLFYDVFHKNLQKEYPSKEFQADYITSSLLCIIGAWFTFYPYATPIEVASIYHKLIKNDIFLDIPVSNMGNTVSN